MYPKKVKYITGRGRLEKTRCNMTVGGTVKISKTKLSGHRGQRHVPSTPLYYYTKSVLKTLDISILFNLLVEIVVQMLFSFYDFSPLMSHYHAL